MRDRQSLTAARAADQRFISGQHLGQKWADRPASFTRSIVSLFPLNHTQVLLAHLKNRS